MQRDGWRLAPAYDMNPNLAKSEHALRIDDRDASPDIDVALSTARYYSLNPREAQSILEEVRHAVGGWRRFATALKISKSDIEIMSAAFHHDAA